MADRKWGLVAKREYVEHLRTKAFWIGILSFPIILILSIGLSTTDLVPKVKSAMGEANIFRGLFFSMTFLTIGVVSNFKKLWEEGIARLAAVYVICLFGFIIWVGLLISWLFFHGVKPPVIG